MLDISDSFDIYISDKTVDMRKAVNGLSLIVLEELELSPQSESMFIFLNRPKDRIKTQMWDKMVACLRRLRRIRNSSGSSYFFHLNHLIKCFRRGGCGLRDILVTP